MRMSVIEWLLDSDPSIRWQVMRDLIAESDATVARERSRVAAEGWGARLLDLQGSDGHWGGAAFVPHAWISTMDTLQLLRDLGVDPASDRMRRAIDQVRDRCTWTQISFPTCWHYDILWGLDYLRRAGVAPDERMAEALELVWKKRDEHGRWPPQNPHP